MTRQEFWKLTAGLYVDDPRVLSSMDVTAYLASNNIYDSVERGWYGVFECKVKKGSEKLTMPEALYSGESIIYCYDNGVKEEWGVRMYFIIPLKER